MARIVPHMRVAATMTRHLVPLSTCLQRPLHLLNLMMKRQNRTLALTFAVVTMFTVGETFPCDPLAATYSNKETGNLIARTELQRRSTYM